MKPCKKCGSTDRYASGCCKECKRISGAAWRLANKERKKASSAAWAKENADRKKETNAAWIRANKDRVRMLISEWSKKNPDARSTHNRNRRARKRGNGGELSKGLFDKLFELQMGKCVACGCKLSRAKPRSPMDHIVPIAKGGMNTDENMQILCITCNSKKSIKDNLVFMQEKGFLI